MQLCDTRHVLDWNTFMYLSKSELLDLYKKKKSEGMTVYFQGQGKYQGLWQLDKKGDIVLVDKTEK